MSAVTPEKTPMRRVYVWELPVRLTHWVMAVAIIVLAVTGYYIGHPFISVPGAAKDHFVMGTMRAVHLYAAFVFIAALLVRFYWLFAGNAYARLGELVPFSPRRFRSILHAFLFYAFWRRDPDDYPGHNALAGTTYAAIYAIYVVMIVTGLVLYAAGAPPDSPFHGLERLAPWLYGLPMTRLIHHVGLWIIAIFVVFHVYFVLLASIIEHTGTMDSIFSGYKFVAKREPSGRD